MGKNQIIKSLYKFLQCRSSYKKYTYKELRKICNEGHWDRFEIDKILTQYEVEEHLKEIIERIHKNEV